MNGRNFVAIPNQYATVNATGKTGWVVFYFVPVPSNGLGGEVVQLRFLDGRVQDFKPTEIQWGSREGLFSRKDLQDAAVRAAQSSANEARN